MTRSLMVRPEAEADIAQAFDWYEARLPGLGSEFLLVLDAAFNSILRNHLLHPKIHKTVRQTLTRRFPLAVFFLSKETRIVILSVFHVKRSPDEWKKRA